MVLAALIIIGDDAPAHTVVGLQWPEFQVRRAVAAGARHVVVAVERVERSLVITLDRLRAEGVTVDLVRAPGEAGDRFHPDEAVLVLSGTLVVASDLIAEIAAADAPVVICLREPAFDGLERVDRSSHWSGVARLTGAQVRRTSALVGDWDLASTLLRGAVQDGAARIMLDEAQAARAVQQASDATSARAISQRSVRSSSSALRGWGERFVVEPLARLVAAALIERSRPVVVAVPPLLVTLALAAVALAWSGRPAMAAGVILLAGIGLATGRRVGAATGLRLILGARLVLLIDAAAALALLAATLKRTTVDHGPLVLAAAVLVTLVLSARLRQQGQDGARWLADTHGVAVVVLVGGAIGGAVGADAALLAGAVHGVATLAWLQNRLSPVLTTPH